MKLAAWSLPVIAVLAVLVATAESADPPAPKARRDAGAELFAKHCSECHRYDGHDGTGKVPKDKAKSPDLKGFASREWIAGFLDPKQIGTDKYYGATKMFNPPGGGKKSKMVRFVIDDIPEFPDRSKKQIEQSIIALSAEAGLEYQKEADAASAADIKAGRIAMNEDNLACADCHAIPGVNESGSGPDLIGYGSKKWIIGLLKDPEHDENPKYFSPKWNEMPKFADKLTEEQMGQIADFIRSGK